MVVVRATTQIMTMMMRALRVVIWNLIGKQMANSLPTEKTFFKTQFRANTKMWNRKNQIRQQRRRRRRRRRRRQRRSFGGLGNDWLKDTKKNERGFLLPSVYHLWTELYKLFCSEDDSVAKWIPIRPWSWLNSPPETPPVPKKRTAYLLFAGSLLQSWSSFFSFFTINGPIEVG